MNIFLAQIYCMYCRRQTYQQVYALTWHAQHTCLDCGEVSIERLSDVA